MGEGVRFWCKSLCVVVETFLQMADFKDGWQHGEAESWILYEDQFLKQDRRAVAATFVNPW